ncbi:hypothetical protein B0J11DRAFT_500900 [Dendryphion nanum]|uniref:Uncharacterized protein n=1 Tax=Dendryphion nanum TaxID=256645 RepID=A0A9P9EJM9_9PLEO|nr:hypothetical protein B0J11DRAFT_500900 [Dendryphion nanum]
MVRFSIVALSLLAMCISVTAIPSLSTSSTAPFTFAQWIEDIITNPDGDHLTPEEAVAAKNAAEASRNPLTKRAWCQETFTSANANDAAACLNDLARKSAAGVYCEVGWNQSNIQMCRIGSAEIVGSKVDIAAQGANCNDVARTGGLIFDSCWRADNTVKGSEICISNNRLQININGV